MKALAKNPNYICLIGASGATNLADGIASVAFPWLATLLTRDPFLIGLVAFAGRLPWLLLSVPAGVITDRSDRRNLIVRAEVVRDNAAQTLMPSVVPSDDLERANGRLWTVETVVGRFVGPPLAGFLIAYALPAPFLLDAVAFGFAAFLVWCIALPPRVSPPKRSWRIETMEGHVGSGKDPF